MVEDGQVRPHHQDRVSAALPRPAGRCQQPQLPGPPHGRGPVSDTELGVDAAEVRGPASGSPETATVEVNPPASGVCQRQPGQGLVADEPGRGEMASASASGDEPFCCSAMSGS
jgi:hypothetical protein